MTRQSPETDPTAETILRMALDMVGTDPWRGLAYGMMNTYLVKTASVFMITTSTIALYTRLTPRWLAIGGYVIAIILRMGSYYLDWSLMVFPFWVLLVSLSILWDKEAAPDST